MMMMTKTIETNINIYEDEAPFERNLRLRAKAERFEQKKNKKIREAKKIAFQRLLDIQDETVKNRVRLNHRVLELEQTKHKSRSRSVIVGISCGESVRTVKPN